MNTNNASTAVTTVSSDMLRALLASHEKLVAGVDAVATERDALKSENEEMRAMLADLKGYLLSGKFSTDTTVQVADVLARIGAR